MDNDSILTRPYEDERESEVVFAAQHSPAAFQQIYDRWVVPVYRYLYFQTGNPADAEDLTSQVFLSAYQALGRYRHQGHFSAWLFTIARNQAIEFFRRRKRSREVALDAAGQLAGSLDLAAESDQRADIARLQDLVRSLADDEQELIRLRYVAELSFGEIAQVLGKREDAVKKSLYRLQARLQRQMEDAHA